MGPCFSSKKNKREHHRDEGVEATGSTRSGNNTNANTDKENGEVLSVKDVKINIGGFVKEQQGRIDANYRIGATLGTGAFGFVKKVTHKPTGSVRAMKIISKGSMTREEESKRFLNEIEILKNLDHPNILKLYEFYQDQKNYYLITEYCTGGELFDKIISLKHFNEQLAADTMHQVLSAVSYCHSNRIVHRDLKPENLLLESTADNANVKVIDFGTSRSFNRNTKMNQKYGTPYYIAPEVLKKKYDERCDVWSCGVILYILLCGYPPFAGPNDDAILQLVARGAVKFDGPEWKRVSPEAKGLIKKMMAYNPEERITCENALNDPWIRNRVKKETLDNPVALETLSNLKSFTSTTKLQLATMTFIASQLATRDEIATLQKTFKALDTNNDGTLSKEELIEGYTKIYGDLALATAEADRVMEEVDIDKSGAIDYTEFVTATLKKNSLLTTKKLEAAFRAFDKDGNGSISMSELKELLGASGNMSEEVWQQIMKEVDANGDGEISFEEFRDMMMKGLDPEKE